MAPEFLVFVSNFIAKCLYYWNVDDNDDEYSKGEVDDDDASNDDWNVGRWQIQSRSGTAA